MSIGSKIKHFRGIRKLTQVELAKKANISRSYLADVESDRYNPSLETLEAIANALNVSTASLIGTADSSIETDNSITVHPKAKRIIDSLARAKELNDADYDLIADQVERLLEYAKKKKRT